MLRTTAFPVLALASGLVLTGGSASSGQNGEPTTAAPSPVSATAENTLETYELGQTSTAATSYGAKLTVEIPTAGPAEVERLREDLRIAPIGYAKVEIDNRGGAEGVSAYLVTAYDEDGTAYEFSALTVHHIAIWGPDYTDALGGVEGKYDYTLADGAVLEESIGGNLSVRSTTVQTQFHTGTQRAP